MDIQKVLLLIKEHGTSLFLFQILLFLKIYSQHIQFDNNLSACSMEWLQVFNVFHQLLCIVSFTEADWHCYKLEWKRALSRTCKVIHQRSIFIFPYLCKIKMRGSSKMARMVAIRTTRYPVILILCCDVFMFSVKQGVPSDEELEQLSLQLENWEELGCRL